MKKVLLFVVVLSFIVIAACEKKAEEVTVAPATDAAKTEATK